MGSKKKIIIATLALLLLTGSGVGWWRFFYDPKTNLDEYKPKAESREQVLPPEEEPIPLPEVEPTDNLTVDNISNGAAITSGAIIKGRVASPEGILHITVKGAASGKISDYTIKVTPSEQPVPYSFELTYEKPPHPGESGVLDIYTTQDGIRAYSELIEVKLQ